MIKPKGYHFRESDGWKVGDEVEFMSGSLMYRGLYTLKKSLRGGEGILYITEGKDGTMGEFKLVGSRPVKKGFAGWVSQQK